MRSSSNRLIVSILVVAAVAVAFWMLALGPKRKEASDLSSQLNKLNTSLAESQNKVSEALAAKHEFPDNYRQLVVLGKAVPGSDDTSSLLVELNQIADHAHVRFSSIKLGSESSEAVAPAPAPAPAAPTPAEGTSGAVQAAASVPPTEAAAAEMPLGATIGTAGLGVMPYDLTFSGNFFHVADFIKGIDSLVHAGGPNVSVGGRLMTVNGFALNEAPSGFPQLNATFSVTTYLTPPSQGVTASATPTAPAGSEAVPAAAPTESPPEAESTPVDNPK
jgi:Tfp pilus assembly protein PilO